MANNADQHQLSVNQQNASNEGQSLSNEERMNEASSANDDQYGNRDEQFMDIDRMVNEGLGGGTVTVHNGLIEDTTTDTMDDPESVLDE